MASRLTLHRDPPGAAWEKRGNTVWVRCASCDTWFPGFPGHAAARRPAVPLSQLS